MILNVILVWLLCTQCCGIVQAFIDSSSIRHRHPNIAQYPLQMTLDDTFAFPQQTPHSGRHFVPSHPAYQRKMFGIFKRPRRKRFMEGWYYRLTIPEENVSFAFIISIEDPGTDSKLKLSCIQVVGPDDSYLVQADRDDSKFWAHKNQQALGCNFRYVSDEVSEEMKYETALTQEQWKENVESGFQILPQQFLGRVDGHDGSQGGVLPGQGVPGFCEFDFSVEPLCGWGSQKSTGGWLASYAVFEPHWQVTLAGTSPSSYI